MWRLVLRRAVFTPSLFEISYELPLLFAPASGESLTSLADRQAAAADMCIFVDACLSKNGIGIYAPHHFTVFMDFPFWSYFVDYAGSLHRLDINVLEFCSAVFGVLFYVVKSLPLVTTSSAVPFHIHVWTDNSATFWKFRTHRAHYPLYVILLQILAYVQLRWNVIVTIGHIPGHLKIYANCLSRRFLVPHGPSIFRVLSYLPHYNLQSAWNPLMQVVALVPWKRPSAQALVGLMLMEFFIGSISALPTSNLSMPPVKSL